MSALELHDALHSRGRDFGLQSKWRRSGRPAPGVLDAVGPRSSALGAHAPLQPLVDTRTRSALRQVKTVSAPVLCSGKVHAATGLLVRTPLISSEMKMAHKLGVKNTQFVTSMKLGSTEITLAKKNLIVIIRSWPADLNARANALSAEFTRLKSEYCYNKSGVTNSDEELDYADLRRKRPDLFEDLCINIDMLSNLNLLVQQLASQYDAFDPIGAAAEPDAHLEKYVEKYEENVERMLELSMHLEVVPPFSPRVGLRVRMYLEGASELGSIPASQLLELYDRTWEKVENNRAAVLVTFDNQHEDLALEQRASDEQVLHRKTLSAKMEYTFSQLALELDAIAKKIIPTNPSFDSARKKQLNAFSERVFTTWQPPTRSPEGAPWWHRVPRSYPWSGAGGHNNTAPPPRGIQMFGPDQTDDGKADEDKDPKELADLDELAPDQTDDGKADEDKDLDELANTPKEVQTRNAIKRIANMTPEERIFKAQLEHETNLGRNPYKWLYELVNDWLETPEALTTFQTRFKNAGGAIIRERTKLWDIMLAHEEWSQNLESVKTEVESRKLALSEQLRDIQQKEGDIEKKDEELRCKKNLAYAIFHHSGHEEEYKRRLAKYETANKEWVESQDPLYVHWRAVFKAEEDRKNAAMAVTTAVEGTPERMALQTKYLEMQRVYQLEWDKAKAKGECPDIPNAPHITDSEEGTAYKVADEAFKEYMQSKPGHLRQQIKDITAGVLIPYKGKDGVSERFWLGYPVQKEVHYRRQVLLMHDIWNKMIQDEANLARATQDLQDRVDELANLPDKASVAKTKKAESDKKKAESNKNKAEDQYKKSKKKSDKQGLTEKPVCPVDWLDEDGKEIVSVYDAVTMTGRGNTGRMEQQGDAIHLVKGRPFQSDPTKVAYRNWVWGRNKEKKRPGELFKAWPLADPTWNMNLDLDTSDRAPQGIDEQLCEAWMQELKLEDLRDQMRNKATTASEWYKVGNLGREPRGGTSSGNVAEVRPAKPFVMKRQDYNVKVDHAESKTEENKRIQEELNGLSKILKEISHVSASRAYSGEATRQRMQDIEIILRNSEACVWRTDDFPYRSTGGLKFSALLWREITDPPVRQHNASVSMYLLSRELDETSGLSEKMDWYKKKGYLDRMYFTESTIKDPSSKEYGFRTYTLRQEHKDTLINALRQEYKDTLINEEDGEEGGEEGGAEGGEEGGAEGGEEGGENVPSLVLKPYAVVVNKGHLEIDLPLLERFYHDLYEKLRKSAHEWHSLWSEGRDSEWSNKKVADYLQTRFCDDFDPVYGIGDRFRPRIQNTNFVGSDGVTSIRTRIRQLSLTEFPEDTDRETKWRAVIGVKTQIVEWLDPDSGLWNPIVDRQPYKWNMASSDWEPLPWDDRSRSFRELGWEADELNETFRRNQLDARAISVVDKNDYGIAVRRKLYPDAPDTTRRWQLDDGLWYGYRDPSSYEWIPLAKRQREPSSTYDPMMALTDRVLGEGLRDWAPVSTVRLTTKERLLLQWFNESQIYAAGGYTDLRAMLLDNAEPRVRVDAAMRDPNDQVRKDQMSIEITRDRMKEIGMVCSALWDPIAQAESMRQLISRGILVQAGEPPFFFESASNTASNNVKLYWIQPKDEGSYEFTVPQPRDPDEEDGEEDGEEGEEGLKNGMSIKYDHCFGIWDPIEGEWIYFPRRRVMPIKERHAPINEGYAFVETGGVKKMERDSCFYELNRHNKPYNGLTQEKINNLKKEAEKLNREERNVDLHSSRMQAESGWGSQHFGPVTYEPGHHFSLETKPVVNPNLSIQPVVYYTPNLRHVDLLKAFDLEVDWTPVYIQSEDNIIPDIIPGQFETGNETAPWGIWNNTNAVWQFLLDPSDPNRLMSARSPVVEYTEQEADDNLEDTDMQVDEIIAPLCARSL